jgi:LPS-assembly lipoprotein
MWLSKRHRPTGPLTAASRGRALLLAGCLLALTGCEFRPLYAERPAEADDGGYAASFEQVRIMPIPNRSGQILHNYLRDEINPRGQPVDPVYALRVNVTEDALRVGVRKDETATRANLRVIANFELLDTTRGVSTLTGRTATLVSYNLLSQQPFATNEAEVDARERALETISRDISTRLAAHFEEQQKAAQAPSQP